MLEAFPPQDRGKAMAFWGLGIVVAPMLGPVLGGWLTDNYSWRWVFYINLPVGLASIIMTRLFIFDPPYIRRSEPRHRLLGNRHAGGGRGRAAGGSRQGPGGGLVRLQLDLALAILSRGPRLSLFMVHEMRRGTRWCTSASFKNRTYSAGVFLMTVLGFVLYGSMLLLPILLQTLLGYPALRPGLPWPHAAWVRSS